MLKLLTISAIREIETLAIQEGISEEELMLRAGTALARRAAAYLKTLPSAVEQARVTFLIGPGKNGGDGLVAGRVLAENTSSLVRFYMMKNRPQEDPLMQPIIDGGYLVANAEDDLRYRVLTQLVASADIVIDALFGIGAAPPLRPDSAKLLRAAAQALREVPEPPPTWVVEPGAPSPRAARPYVLACDCPSGLNVDTGEADAQALIANETLTFIAPKPGLFVFPGAAYVGKLTVAALGIPDKFKPLKDAKSFLADSSYVGGLLPKRPDDSHKGSFGKLMVVGGSVNYLGAPALAADAAYRSGAGLVVMASTADVVDSHAGHLREVTWVVLPSEDGVIAQDATRVVLRELHICSALVLGPGIGAQPATRAFVQALLQGKSSQPEIQRPIGFQHSTSAPIQSDTQRLPPLVVDADALNLLATIEGWQTLLPEDTILTPHPGEMARLCAMETHEVQERREALAREKAKSWKCVVLLKGAHTIAAAPDGRVAVLPFKTSALAKAGTGDVLAGLCGGLLAQGMKPFDAAVAAAYIHGLAGNLAETRVHSARSVLASEVAAHIGEAYRAVESGE